MESVMRRTLDKCLSRLARTSRRGLLAALALAGPLAGLALAQPAAAGLAKEFSVFAQCPVNTPGVEQCIYSETTSGKFKLDLSEVPINKTITLQGGLNTKTEELVPALNGETLSKTPLQVPGGLLGIEGLGNLTEVNAVAELAGTVKVNVINALTTNGTAVSLPVRVKLENPLLGASCLIGSNSNPVSPQLTTGTTSPPKFFKPLTGAPGTQHLTAEGKIAEVNGSSLVDNTFSVPGAQGCGGLLFLLVDPSLDLKVGIPAGPGFNQAILNGKLELSSAKSVRTQAGLPEIGRCVKVPAEKVEKINVYHGNFANSGCTEEASGGMFEWTPGLPPAKTFSVEGKTLSLETTGKKKILCLASSGSGEYTSTKAATLNVTLSGCTRTSTKETCQSEGASAGSIAINGLAATLGFIKDEATEKEGLKLQVGWDLTHGATFLAASCGASKEAVNVTGSVIGAAPSINKMLPSFTIAAKAKLGLQTPEAFEEQPKDVLSASFGGGAEAAGLTASPKFVNGEKLEIRGSVE
jgi:hypothetical protein